METKKTNKFTSSIKTFYRNNPWKGRFILAALSFILIVVIARLALPNTVIYAATNWLQDQGIESSIEDIDFNIFDGSVALLNAQGKKDGNKLFNVGRVELHWNWKPLSKKTISITKVVLDDISLNIRQYTDKLILGGVQLPLGQPKEEDEPPAEDVKPWAAALEEVTFSNLNICYLQHTALFENADDKSKFVDYCVSLDKMSWGGSISYATDKALLETSDLPIASTGNFSLNGLKVVDNKLNKTLLSAADNSLNNVVISGLNSINIDTLSMTDISALQRDDKTHVDAVRFHQLNISDIKLSSLNKLSLNKITFDKPGLYLVKNDKDSWEYQPWIPPEKADTKQEETEAKDAPTEFNVSIGEITVNKPDFCYLENKTSLYYCFTAEKFDWQGKLQYSTAKQASEDLSLKAAGNLQLNQPNIHNHTIKRNLLDLNSIELATLNMNGLNDITLAQLQLKNLAALQRSEKQKDNTAMFDSFVVKDIAYKKDSIAIDTITLDGLAANASKNKKGLWEHNKWRQENDTATEDNKTATTEKPAEKDFTITVNKITVNSDKKILYADNSTTPATTAGLQKLSFEADKLYSTKPDSNSPFKLYAKTVRHSTIDIKGTTKPFAEKVSFDAKGKLKGFDLRAASAETKKAIGHTIQSGQLDADLKLLAVNGKLDSNVALSLYKFNIKSLSKKDAEELDKKFGMPLNQTLVLLRDKDGSIHLDIPITGDVNNPNFDPMDAIITATSKAATVTLITFYTPYGLVYAGGNVLFDLATALNFDPIAFTPGSAELADKNREQLDNLSKLLKEKPQVRLTLCGVSNQKDATALYPAPKAKDAKTSDAKTETKSKLTKEQMAALTQLAKKRQENTKNYLINQAKIGHERLILCAPEHKSQDDAVAGVEINI